MENISIIVLPDAQLTLDLLCDLATHSRRETVLLIGIYKRLDILRSHPQYGDHISRKLIPAEYIIKYAVHNLFRVDLPGYWRMLYTIRKEPGSEATIIEILDVLDHKSYDKKFGYKGR